MFEFLSVFRIDQIIEGLQGIVTPYHLSLMVVGVILASLVAAAPGIGSLLLLSLLLPFATTLEPFGFIALIFGVATVGNTANTFSSVLVGVPGGSGSQATILDGFPMAKNGEANRAFGAAFMASLVGAIIGATTFMITLPFFSPLVLSIGSPEFLMLVLWGLSAVAVLGGSQPVKGLIGAVFGLSVALIGTDARTGIERFTFGSAYLWDGVSLVIVAMGIFAVPEMVNLARRKTSISDTPALGGGLWKGVTDVYKHWWLVTRCSMVGVWVGALPGLGSAVADWFAYAHAVQTEKNTENFGKGDVRGVLAPESSNNAKEGGDLIPTLLFGIPGSSSMAIILIGMIAVGIQPGTAILTYQAPYMYATVWTLVIANIMATLLALAFARQFAKACIVPYTYLVPAVFLFCIIGAYANTLDYYDLGLLLVFSAIGILMKRYGWPRPPVLVAIVLGPQVQQYLWLSVDLYSLGWLLHPSVLFLGLLIAGTLSFPLIRARLQRGKNVEMELKPDLERAHEKSSIAMSIALTGVFVAMLVMGTMWPLRASLPVYFIACLGLILVSIQIIRDTIVLKRRASSGEIAHAYSRSENLLELNAWLWLVGLVLLVVLFGFHLTFFIFPLAYGFVYGANWRREIIVSAGGLALLWLIFDRLLGAVWPQPLLLWFLY